MNKKTEIYQDITTNCDIVLGLLKPFEAENDTPEGRMIYQCRWLKEQVAANTLALPTTDYVYTLKYVNAEKLLAHLSSSDENYNKEVGVYLYRLLKLIKNKLLLKSAYYPYTIHMLDALLYVLKTSTRPLSICESRLDDELEQLKTLLSAGKIEPPLMSYLPDYFDFRGVYRINKSSLDDQPNGKYLVKTTANLIFEGIRSDSWLTPEDAAKDVAQYPT